MEIKGLLHLFLILLALSVVHSSEDALKDSNLVALNRSNFPAGFIFGTASSAYQYEGAANEDDRIKDHNNGANAVDSDHRYKEDVAIMKDLGFDAYRFSISWSRLVPKAYASSVKVAQKGQIGLTLNSNWMLPSTESATDRIAASRALVFQNDWFMEPLKSGMYPVEMVTYVHERLPQFSEEQALMLKESLDFIGINYYTSNYASDIPCKTENLSYSTDYCVSLTSERNGIPIGLKVGSEGLYAYPKGIEDLLLYTKYKFNNPVIYITENGVSELDQASLSLEDNMRVDYYSSHLSYIQRAIT
ncbi:unnamed protein product [Dovyalis caffra]|uniref:Beta-glucosidase n=1 Tax=Dovyalis caffra TaxID=77055 RepID=A0AAV1RA33_9ROSI|nr:unnamed protein product [Dovyalis caffra]